MDDSPELFQIDSETLYELSQAIDALAEYYGWLIERKDLEQTERLTPIVDRLVALMLGIAEGLDPRVGPVVDSLNRADDAIQERIDRATTLDEKEEALKHQQRFWERVGTIIKEGQVKLAKREEELKKGSKQ